MLGTLLRSQRLQVHAVYVLWVAHCSTVAKVDNLGLVDALAIDNLYGTTVLVFTTGSEVALSAFYLGRSDFSNDRYLRRADKSFSAGRDAPCLYQG